MLAPGEAEPSLGISRRIKSEPAKLATDLTPQMTFVKVYSMRPKQSFKFFFKRMLSMMHFLIPNISSHSLDLRLANCKGAEPSLPAEPAICLSLRPT